jgi:hypothetical protein
MMYAGRMGVLTTSSSGLRMTSGCEKAWTSLQDECWVNLPQICTEYTNPPALSASRAVFERPVGGKRVLMVTLRRKTAKRFLLSWPSIFEPCQVIDVDRVKWSISNDPLSTKLCLPIGLRHARAVSCQSVFTCSTRPNCEYAFRHSAGRQEVRSGIQPVREAVQEGPILRRHVRV